MEDLCPAECTEDLCPEEKNETKTYFKYWIKEYCTFESGAVDPILLFYPLILLIIPSIMFFSEMSFHVKLHLILINEILSKTM